MRASRMRRRNGEMGQALPLIALCMLVVTGFAGLSVDLGHQFDQKRIGQTAVDSAAVAAAAQLGQQTGHAALGTAPSTWNDQVVATAHDYVAGDGFSTVWPASQSAACLITNTNSQLSEEFFDSSYSGSCTSTPSGYATEVIVNVPPLSYSGWTTPKACNASLNPPGYPYNCVQVVVAQRVGNYLMQVVGFQNEYITTIATALANPSAQGANLPIATAVQLTQPTSEQKSCNPGSRQCFDEADSPQRTVLACNGFDDNCPTLLNANSHDLFIEGADGSIVPPRTGHFAAVSSAGDILNSGNHLNLCDPDGFTCANGQAGTTSSQGYALAPNASLYCNGMVTNPTTGNPNSGGSPSETCTASGYTSSPVFNQSNLQQIVGNPTTYSVPPTWTLPTPATPGNQCGGLILNGDPIKASNSPPVFFTGSPPAAQSAGNIPANCVPNSAEPFTIMPGKYDYIVINFGQYAFEGGSYDILGNAPVNTITPASNAVEPNGIDHSQEQGVGAANTNPGNVDKDWDLCLPANSDTVTGCTQTAGLWIGQGSNKWKFGAQVNPTGTQCSNGTYVGGTGGGGGQSTNITGTAVSFRFEAASSGFVSTAEVSNIALGAPAVGALASINGEPILFDVESPTGYVHLDSNNGNQGTGAFAGLIYQTPSATGGGVDIDPGMGSSGSKATLTGQVIAYRLALFGHGQGTAVDFSGWWGTGTQGAAGAGHNESSLITVPDNALTAGDRSGANTGTKETLYLQYNDEWSLDGYDVSVTIDNLTTTYFSTGLWTLNPPNSSSTPARPWPPQNGYVPSDANPMFATKTETNPSATAYGGGAYSAATAYYDNMTLPSPAYAWVSGGSAKPNEVTYDTAPGMATDTTFDISGDWTWGNQSNVPVPGGATVVNHQRSDKYSADIYFTFPIPAGQTLQVSFHSVDGDHCGDYSNTTMAFNNVTRVGGATSGNSVQLVQ